MAIWLHGTLYVTIHEARNVPLDRRIRLPDKVIPDRCCFMKSYTPIYSLAYRNHSNLSRVCLP